MRLFFRKNVHWDKNTDKRNQYCQKTNYRVGKRGWAVVDQSQRICVCFREWPGACNIYKHCLQVGLVMKNVVGLVNSLTKEKDDRIF